MPTTDLITTSPDKEVSADLEVQETNIDTFEDNLSPENNQVCENCKLPLAGPFCAQCGQEADSKLKYFWVVIMHILDDILSFDSRAARTVWPLMVKPGFLTNEYFAGRRVHYVPPIRLYLFISIVFFVTLKFFVAADNQSVSQFSNKVELASQVKSHIDKLQNEQQVLQSTSPQSEETLESIATTNADITRFESYLEDIKRDESEGVNKKLLELTHEIVQLEIEGADAVLPADKKERLDVLIASRLKLLEGLSFAVKGLNLEDEDDEAIKVDFLSEETNTKLKVFLRELIKKAGKTFNSDPGPLIDQVTGTLLPQLMFILLPLFAFLLKFMFMFSKRLYMEHLTVALHSHCFIYLALFISELLSLGEDQLALTSPTISDIFAFASVALIFWIPVYLFKMQRRVYKQGFFFTFVKFFIIGSIYTTMIALTGLIALVLGVMGS